MSWSLCCGACDKLHGLYVIRAGHTSFSSGARSSFDARRLRSSSDEVGVLSSSTGSLFTAAAEMLISGLVVPTGDIGGSSFCVAILRAWWVENEVDWQGYKCK